MLQLGLPPPAHLFNCLVVCPGLPSPPSGQRGERHLAKSPQEASASSHTTCPRSSCITAYWRCPRAQSQSTLREVSLPGTAPPSPCPKLANSLALNWHLARLQVVHRALATFDVGLCAGGLHSLATNRQVPTPLPPLACTMALLCCCKLRVLLQAAQFTDTPASRMPPTQLPSLPAGSPRICRRRGGCQYETR